MKIILWTAWASMIQPGQEVRFDQKEWAGTMAECVAYADTLAREPGTGKKFATCWRVPK